jgi:hypothetical protein
MPSLTVLSTFSELPSPVLTAYLNVQSPEPSTHRPGAEYSIWLEEEAKRLIETVPPTEQEVFRQQVARTEEFLRERISREKALVILAGSTVWESMPFQLPIENELHWGRPALTQLQWLFSENKSYCVVVLDRKGARFFRYGLGEMQELFQQIFEIDISQWKKKELGHVTGQGVHKTRGSQRDTYQHRMDAQYKRLCRKTATYVQKLCQSDKLRTAFLVGSDRLTEPVEASLPKQFRQHVVLINEDLGGLPLDELQEYLKPRIAEWQGKEELALVTRLLQDERTAVTGVDETLAQLQKSRLRTMVVADHLTGILHECIECGWTDRSADPVCSVCGRERKKVELRGVVHDLARSTGTEIEVVSGAAAIKLNQAGGMGGWLKGRTQAQLR